MSSAGPSIMTGSTVRPYRDFLTPALHRRFTSGALLSLVVCYGIAILMGGRDMFWSWFPFGPTGFRTLLLFISILAIYILRVAQMHIGARTMSSPLNTSVYYLSVAAFTTGQTFLWYLFSAWFFGELYIWSASADAKFSVVDVGKPYERARLNERPIFLRTMFLCLGVAQTIYHLYKDYDRIPFETPKTFAATTSEQQSSTFVKAITQIRKKLLSVTIMLPIRTALTVVIATIMYALLLRHMAWAWTFAIAKNLYSLPKASRPSAIPSSPVGLVLHAYASAILLNCLWEFANLAFNAFVSQEPLKKGKSLSHSSKPLPNFTLIAGLKSKKEIIKTFAYWELLMIAQTDQERRSTIYSNYKGANRLTAWSEIVSVSLGELHAVVKRIQDYQQSKSTSNPPGSNQQQESSIQNLPKITAPLKQDNILISAPPTASRVASIENNIGAFAKAHGQSPGATDPVSPRARKLLTYTENILPESTRLQTNMKEQFQSYALSLLQSSMGIPFRQTFARRAAAVVFGGPYSQLSPIVDAVNALTTLAVSSPQEDTYGIVSSDVPNIIRTFTRTCDAIEKFVQGLPVHWTDVEFSDGSEEYGRTVAEVELLLTALRNGLKLLVNQFGEYADNLGLSRAEIRQAKEVVQRGSKEKSES